MNVIMKKFILVLSMALASTLAFAQNGTDGGETLYIIDGVVATKAAADELPSETIRNMNVVKGVESVVIITTKAGREITGRVVDTEGKPMMGVIVEVPMSKSGVVTDFDGCYKIILPAGEAFLRFSFIDYPSKTVQVDKAEMEDVVMDKNASNDVIVIKDLKGDTITKDAILFLAKKPDGEICKIDNMESIPANQIKTMHVFKAGAQETEQFQKYGNTSGGVVLIELK